MKVDFLFHAALLSTVLRGTPLFIAAFVDAALVDPGAKTVVSMPLFCRAILTHRDIVFKVACLYGFVVVTNKFLSCLNGAVLCMYEVM